MGGVSVRSLSDVLVPRGEGATRMPAPTPIGPEAGLARPGLAGRLHPLRDLDAEQPQAEPERPRRQVAEGEAAVAAPGRLGLEDRAVLEEGAVVVRQGE